MQNRVFNNLTAILFLFLFIPFLLNAQNGDRSFEKEFAWENGDESKTIIINVATGAKMIQMDFEGTISDGSLQLTAYDPEGNKVGGSLPFI